MTRKRILVVDDEIGMTRMLKRNLEATGLYEVRTENSSAAALGAAHEFRPDLIFLDVMMPGMDGGEVAARLGADKQLKQIPIVFLSAILKEEETEPSGGEIGGFTFLAKPFRIDDLLSCIKKKLNK